MQRVVRSVHRVRFDVQARAKEEYLGTGSDAECMFIAFRKSCKNKSMLTGTGDRDTNAISRVACFVVVVQIAPCIPSSSAFVEGLAGVALAHGHGLQRVLSVCLLHRAADEAERLADGCRALVIIPEIMSADGVVVPFVQHLGDDGLSRHG